MPDPKNMSVEEVLAACRAMDGGGDSSAAEEAEITMTEKPAEEAAKPAAAKPAKVDAKSMSVADMLAAARAETAGGGKAADKPAKAKPAAKAPAGKAKPAAKAKPSKAAVEPRDTASILAAARKSAKPGPISKLEAKARTQPESAAAKPKKTAPPMPAKPDYAIPGSAAESPRADVDQGRRGFIATVAAVSGVFLGSSMSVGFASLAVTHVLWGLGTARFMFPNILTEPPTRFKVGFPDDYGPGQVQTKFKAQFGVWIVRHEYEGESQVYALKSVCTHLGCTPNWLEGEQKFKCPCHGSGFYKDGINFEGPAPRPLERYAISRADDGQLEVDKSRVFNEELGQWVDPACFVTV